MSLSRTRQTGSLLIITLWVVIIVGALAVAIGRYLSLEVKLMKYRMAREQARELARSGVYLAMQRLQQDVGPEADGKTYDWLGDDWAAFPGGDPDDPTAWVIQVQADQQDPQMVYEIRVHMLDEERKLNVNSASKAELESVVGSPDLAKAIIDYYDTADPADETSVDEPPYTQKNSAVVALEELLDIPDMTETIFEKLQQVTFAQLETTATLTPVNINTAVKDVLIAVGFTSLADGIVAFCEADHYFTSLSPIETDDPAATPFGASAPEFLTAQPRLAVSSQTFTINSTGSVVKPSVRFHIEAVVQRSAGGSAPQIIAWREG